MINRFIKRGLFLAPFFLLSCSITAVRPSQEMSNLEVALKAAKEVNADVLAPELYRMATETSIKAHREYKFKNFENAKKLATQARVYAERAEFESLRNGAKRETLPVDPLSEPSYAPENIGSPDPNATPSLKGGAPAPSKSGENDGNPPPVQFVPFTPAVQSKIK